MRRFILGHFIVVTLSFSGYQTSFAQTFNYTSGGLSVNVFVSHPCNGMTDNGLIRFDVISVNTGAGATKAVILFIEGPNGFVFPPDEIDVGASYTYIPTGPQAGDYDFFIRDNRPSGTPDVINTPPAGPPFGVTMEDLPDIVINQETLTNNTNCTTPNGQVVASVSGGSKTPILAPTAGSFTYTWSADNGLGGLPLSGTFNGVGNLDLAALLSSAGLPAGTYNLLIEDDYSDCSESMDFTITDPSPLTYNVSTSTPSLCLGTTGIVSLSNSEGSDVTYEVYLGIPPSTAATGITLQGSNAPLNFNIPLSILSAAGSYDFSVRAVNNLCTPAFMNGTATIVVNPTSTASVLSGTATICSGSSTNLVVTITGGTGPFTVTYFDGTSNQIVNNYASGSNIAVSPTATTTYSLVGVVDANNCTGTGLSGTATVTVNPTSTASVLSGTATICSGSSTNLVVTITGGTGPFTVTYFDGTSNQVVNNYASGSNIAVNPTATTTYSLVSVVDANNCTGTGLSGTATVTVNPTSTASVLSGTATICSGSSTNLVVTITGGTGPFTVTYFDGTSNQVVNNYTSGSNIAVSPTTSITYTLVSVVDANNCTGTGLSGTATVTVNPTSTASVLSGTATICSGSSTNLVVTITGGTGPFTVTYFDGTSNQVVNNYTSGSNIAVSPTTSTTYTLVSVVDANNCTGTGLSGTATVTVNPTSTASVLSGTATICSGSSTNLVVNITGGTGPFTVTYFDGTSNQVVNNYTSGSNIAVSPTTSITYTLVSVVDANNCTGTGLSGTATITVNPTSTASVLNGTATICSGSSANLVVTITGGTGPFTVTYFDGTSNQVVNNYASGSNIAVSPTTSTTYTLVSVVDANNCTGTGLSGTATVTVNPTSTASVLSGTATICSGSSTNLVVTITGGTGPFTVTYFDGTSNLVVNNYASGSNIAVSPTTTTTYSLVGVVDANNCTGTGLSGTATVTVNPTSTASVLSGTATICSGSSTNLVVTITGGTGPFTVTYFDGTSNLVVNNYASGSNIAVSPTTTTTYSLVSVVDANNCTGTGLSGTATVTVNPTSTASVFSGAATICSGSSTNLVVTITGGTGPFTVTYFDGTSNQVVNNYASGSNIAVSPTTSTTYTLVSVVDANNCTGTGLSGTATVTVNPTSTASVLSGTATICSGSSTNLVVTITGGTGPFTVTYFDGTSNLVVNNYASGSNIAVSPTTTTTYSLVSVVDANNCAGTGLSGTATVTVNPTSTASVLSGTATICSGSTNLVVTITGGTGPFTVTYFDGTSNLVVNNYASGSNIAVSPTTSTTYTLVSVVDANNCTGTGLSGTATVTVNPTSTASVLSGTATICLGSSTSLVVTITGGAGTFTVTYFDGTSNQVVNNYASGSNIAVNPTTTTTYSLVSVVDANNCPGTGLSGTATVTVNPTSTASVLSGTATICSGSSTNLVVTITGGTGPFTVTYFDGTSNQVVNNYASGSNIAVSPTASTTYSLVSVVDANNCTGTGLSGTATVTVNPTSTASVLSGTATICSGSSTNLVVTITGGIGPFTVTYFDGTSNQAINNYASGSNIAVSPTASTTYSLVSVVDANNCTGTGLSGTATVTVNPTSTSSVLSGTATICSGSSTNLVVTITGGIGPFTVTYFDGTSNQAINNYASGSNIAVSPTASTTYSLVSVVDANNCTGTGLSGTATVTVNPTSTASVLSGAATICSGSSTNLVVTITGGTGPFTVTYFDGTSNQIVNNYASGSNIAVSPTTTTTYSLVSVVDANNCAGTGLSGTATVTIATIPTFTTVTTDVTACVPGDDGSITVSASGGDGNYMYSNNNGTSFQVQNTFNGLTAGNYLVVVQDGLGCQSAPANVIINSPSGLSASTVVTNPVCNGDLTGTIAINATGGSGVFEYSIDGGPFQGSNSFSGLAAGNYTVTTKDDAGCSFVNIVTITEPALVTFTTSKAEPTCNGSADGSITVAASGGNGVFEYSIDGGAFQASNVFAGLAGGMYSILAQDGNSCLSAGSNVILTNPAAVTASASSTDATTCSPGNDGTITVTASGGTGTLQYSIDGVNFVLSNTFTGLTPGSYTVDVKDANNCFAAPMPLVISTPASPDASFIGLSSSYCETSTAVTLTPSTPGGIFSGPGISGNTFDPAIAGVGTFVIQYQVTVSGCTNQTTQNVDVVSSAIDASFTGLTSPVCTSSGTITLTPATPGGTFSGAGVNGNTFDPAVAGPGTFNIVYDINIGGCTASSSQPVTVVSNTVDASFTGLNIAYCTSSGIATLTPSTAGGTFIGPGITGNQFDPSASGTGILSITYTVTSGGCIASTTQSVAVVPSSDPFCSGIVGTGDCATVAITPKPTPATCTNSDGSIVFSIKPFYPIINNTGVKIFITGVSITNQSISRTNFNDSTFLNLPVGTYDYSIEYGDPACTKTGQVTIDQSGTVGTPVVTNIVNPICPGQPSGSFIINLPGETGNVLEWSLDGITWSQFIVGNQINSIPSGPSPTFQHTVSVRRNSSDPCYGAAIITMQDQTAPIAASYTTQDATCLNNDGKIQLTSVTGGLSPYSYQVNGGVITAIPPAAVIDIDNLASGSYALTIIDGNNCSADYPLNISFPGPPIPVDFVATVSNEICYLQNGGINLTGISGAVSTDYTYEILELGNVVQTSSITALQALSTVNLSGLVPGEYQIRLVQNQTQCIDPISSGYKTVVLTGPTAPLDTISVIRNISYPEQASGSMDIIVAESGVEPYEYSLELTDPLFTGQAFFSDWNQINENQGTGKFEQTANGLYAGTYTLWLRDGLGCEKSFMVTIAADIEIFIPNIFTPNADGMNEEFFIRNLPPATRVFITDRWGKEIYSSSDYQNDWKGGSHPDGVYYYQVILSDKTISGWVEILRGNP